MTQTDRVCQSKSDLKSEFLRPLFGPTANLNVVNQFDLLVTSDEFSQFVAAPQPRNEMIMFAYISINIFANTAEHPDKEIKPSGISVDEELSLPICSKTQNIIGFRKTGHA